MQGEPPEGTQLLFENAILEIWRLSYASNSFNFPLYQEFETEFDITRPEFVTLLCAAHKETVYPYDIYASTLLPKNSISRGLTRLEKKKLIKRTADREDKRRSMISLTSEGRKLYDILIARALDRQALIFDVLTNRERQQLTKLLLKVSMHAAKNVNKV
ncbi:MarR family winged helix-turn-helix transcriptional regulator [Hwanghaeella sp.]|uniref:MarR family winged helix-turn-helix transcriptional regulator n=1 Tax=Hwanghaeella sp. TaxID=2605943 RepID=UPI003CCBCEED